MFDPTQFHQSPNPLAKYYGDFNVENRILLTGHSHQAWPDCAKQGLEQAWQDAALLVDDKWQRAFQKADLLRNWFSSTLDDTDGEIALGQSTHELIIRFISALPLKQRPKIITTDGEFYSLKRQLNLLHQQGLANVVIVNVDPIDSLCERVINAIDSKTSAVMLSSVFFETAMRFPHLDELARACNSTQCQLLVDAYHALNVMPFSIKQQHLQLAFVVGGGYKYCQFGEGNCFLRIPKDTALKPLVSGWFSQFGNLAGQSTTTPSGETYGAGHWSFAGSTYDPTSHYRACRVIDFFNEQHLSPLQLHAINQYQLNHLIQKFDSFNLPPQLISRTHVNSLNEIGGFLALTTPHAKTLSEKLKQQNVFTDYRGDKLRLGPSPYVSDAQLDRAMELLINNLRAL